MKVIENASISQFCWLSVKIYKNGGQFDKLYYPESKEELKKLVVDLQNAGKQYFVFGHTSNCYFLPSFNAETAICTRYLSKYTIRENSVVCQPGAHIKAIARKMTNMGCKSYSGMVDLPGTVAAAVYGNAGCYGCEVKDIVLAVELLLPNGTIRILGIDELGFCRRSSALKRKEIEGVILSVTLKKEQGDKDALIRHAEICHNERLLNQPGPANNLGSCFMSGTKTLKFRIVERIIRMFGNAFGLDKQNRLNILLILFGEKKLIPYLYNLNRFMWKDSESHDIFNEYVSFYRKIYKNANLEIQIF